MTSVRPVVGEGVSGFRGSSGTTVGWTRTVEGEVSRLGDKISGGEMISDSFIPAQRLKHQRSVSLAPEQ